MNVPAALSPLTAAEKRLLRGVERLSSPPEARDPAFAKHPWSRYTVRAEFLRWWLEAASGATVAVHGARIKGAVDLSGQSFGRPIKLTGCDFTAPVNLEDAEFTRLELTGSSLPGLSAARIACDDFYIDGRAVVRGCLNINGGSFGFVTLAGVQIHNPGNVALDANVITTRRSFQMNTYAHIRGNVRFIGASVGGQFNARHCHVEGRFSLHEATIKRAVYLSNSLFEGRVNLSNASIGGWLNAAESHFVTGFDTALLLDGIAVERSMQLTKIVVHGRINMSGARVRGSVRLTRASLRGAPRRTERASDVGRHWATTVLDQLPGQVEERRQGLADGKAGPAVPGFESDPLDGIVALVMRRCTLDLDLEMVGMAVDGRIIVSGVEVAKRLDARWSRLDSADGAALELTDTRVHVTLRWSNVVVRSGAVRLTNVHVGRLDDDPGSWPRSRYELHAVTVGTLDVDRGAWSLDGRLAWLARQTTYSAQPYQMVGRLLLDSGRRDEAWRVFRASAVAKRARPGVPLWRRFGSVARGALIGHGYQPERAAAWLAGVVVVGALLFNVAWGAGAVVPRNPTAALDGRCIVKAACFQPFVHSLDVGLPIIDVGSSDTWTVDARRAPWVTWFVAAETLLGWLFTTAGVAGLTRRAIKT